MLAAEVSTPDSTSLSSAIFVVDEREFQEEPLVRVPKFDGNEAKYRCGCCCHVWVCTLLVGVVELIILVLNLIFTAAAYGTEKADERFNGGGTSIFLFLRSERSLTTGILSAIIGFLVVGLLIHGVLKQKHRFLIPHLIVQVLAIMTSIVLAILFTISSVAMSKRLEHIQSPTPSNTDWTYVESLFNRRLAYRQCVSISVVLTCITVLQGTFFVTVLRCYFYLKEVRRRFANASYMPMVAVKGGVPNA